MLTKKFFTRFLQDERGQSTTEYVLMLSMVVMIAMKFKQKFPELLDKIMGSTKTKMESIEGSDM